VRTPFHGGRVAGWKPANSLTTKIPIKSTVHRRGVGGAVNVYFEESASAGDGSYLDHFTETNKTYFRTVDKVAPKDLKLKDVKMGAKR